MNYILFDPPDIERFYPFTLTRPLGEMRLFNGTIKENWEHYLQSKITYLTREHLASLYDTKWINGENRLISAAYLPPSNKSSKFYISAYNPSSLFDIQAKYYSEFGSHKREDISNLNLETFFKNDFTESTKSMQYFKGVFFNDDDGPIIIEEDVIIMEGAMIRGPVYIGKGSVIKMGAKIYGPVIIGPCCKIGGEVSNSIFLGYSNKAHEGFLGHSIIGQWCNIGAGTSNSNLKNDYGSIKMWDYSAKKFRDSHKQFLGLYMGDHSKCAINTSFNTGTTVGVHCNVFGSGFPRNFIPSFSWGGAQGLKPYDFDKAISVVTKVMARRNIELTKKYIDMLRAVHDITLKMT